MVGERWRSYLSPAASSALAPSCPGTATLGGFVVLDHPGGAALTCVQEATLCSPLQQSGWCSGVPRLAKRCSGAL